MSGLLSVFQRIYIVSLENHVDRRAEMEGEFNRLGLTLLNPRIIVIPPVRKARGTAISHPRTRLEGHVIAHRAVVSDGIDKALILEDHAGFVPAFGLYFERLANTLADQPWDMLHSSATMSPVNETDGIGPYLFYLRQSQFLHKTHFIGFSGEFSARAVLYFDSLFAQRRGEETQNADRIDYAYDHLRRSHPDLRILSTRAPLARPRSPRKPKLHQRIPLIRSVSGGLWRMRDQWAG